MTPPVKRDPLPQVIRALLAEKGEISSGEVAEIAGVTRQAAHYHLSRMVETGELTAAGAGRASRYVRRSLWSNRLVLEGLQEDRVWRELNAGAAQVEALPEDARAVARFAFTEMLNNAIDHSGAEHVEVSVTVTDDRLLLSVIDAGIGAFEHIRSAKGLEDHPAAIQELAKGKLTTDPARHTGEGIFFTSKAVDVFTLISNGWRWIVDNTRGDEAIARSRPVRGTQVHFQIDPETRRSLDSVFGSYTDDETLAFDRTRTVVRLFEYGVAFVSRSEAKRLTRNLERFAEVLVDFHGVEMVGQGFADEVFRVWQREHPKTRLIPVNMNEAVTRFVERARAADPGGPA